MTKREQIQQLKSEGKGPTEIAKIVGCNISLVYYHSDETYRRRSIDRLLKMKIDNKQKAMEYKGGCCAKCGYNRCSAALVFHHIDPTQKEIRIGGVPHTWARLKKELDKTVLLCCLCHTELHAGCWSQEEMDKLGLIPVSFHPTGVNVLPPSKKKSNWIKVPQ
jgi:predicted Zn-ribbon and HTH transcriptional regulator